MAIYRVTAEVLNAAIEGYEAQKRRIDAEIDAIRNMLSGAPAEVAATPEPQKGTRRKMSAAGRKAIAEAQRKRWAVSKGGGSSSDEAVSKPKRKLSAAGRRAISEATKRRWAAKRAAEAKAVPVTAKKSAAKKTAVKKAAKKASRKGQKRAGATPQAIAPAA